MKLMIVALAVASFASSARAEEYENYKIQVDWNMPETLEDSVAQVCDDTYYPAVEITVPGKPRKDFMIEMNVYVNDGAISSGCTVKKIDGSSSTTYIFDGSDGGCEIQIQKNRSNYRERSQVANYSIADAC